MADFMGFDFAAYLVAHFGAAGEHPVSDLTLTRTTKGTRTAGQAASGTNATSVDYACQGFATPYNGALVDGELVRTSDRLVCILADTLGAGAVEPRIGDKVTIDSVVYTVVGDVASDPARSAWSMKGRK